MFSSVVWGFFYSYSNTTWISPGPFSTYYVEKAKCRSAKSLLALFLVDLVKKKKKENKKGISTIEEVVPEVHVSRVSAGSEGKS